MTMSMSLEDAGEWRERERERERALSIIGAGQDLTVIMSIIIAILCKSMYLHKYEFCVKLTAGPSTSES